MNKIIALVACLSVLLTCIFVGGVNVKANAVYAVSEVENLIDGIFSVKMRQSGAQSLKAYLNGYLTDNAGGSDDWYAFSLMRYKDNIDYSGYADALEKFITDNEENNAVARERRALFLAAAGCKSSLISQTVQNSTDKLGLMSRIFGLHLLNNGCRGGSFTAESVVSELLSRRLDDNGWAVSGNVSDVDATAMTVQALAPYYYGNSEVKSAVDKALEMLSQRQLDNGGFKSYGVENPESTAQVVVALSSLGIDSQKDGRFIKNGRTLLDGILSFRLSDGSFSHEIYGASNDAATQQVLYSLVALWRQKKSMSSLYVFSPAAQQQETTATSATKATSQATLETTVAAQDKSNGSFLSNIFGKKPVSTTATGTSAVTAQVSTAAATESQTTATTDTTSSVTSPTFSTTVNTVTSTTVSDITNIVITSDACADSMDVVPTTYQTTEAQNTVGAQSVSNKTQSGYSDDELILGFRKPWLFAVIWTAAVIDFIILIAQKKRKTSYYLSVLLLFLLLSAAVYFL